MRSAYGFVSFDQHLVAGIKEQDARFHTKIIQMAEHCGQIVEIIAGTNIHDCRKLMDVGSGGHHVDQRHQQFGRHVIDHIPAHILNTVGRMRSPRTAHAGDQQYFKTFGRRRSAGMRAIRLRIDIFLCHHRASSSAMRMACSNRAVRS